MLNKKLLKPLLLASFITVVSACSSQPNYRDASKSNLTISNPAVFADREKFYQSTKNYQALINLYRARLSAEDQRNETNPALTYRLAETYFAAKDYNSTLTYLAPLLNNKEYMEQALLLETKALIKLQRPAQALTVASQLINLYPKNADAYNNRAIAYSQLGKPDKAYTDFISARGHYLNDLVAINNLGMLSLVQGDYQNAVRLLMPEYLNGIRDKVLVHNLVFALVKAGKIEDAKDIIQNNQLSSFPDSLISALKATPRFSVKNTRYSHN